MKSRRLSTGAYIVVVAALIGIGGCGGGDLATYPAHGTVTFPDGSPLQGGRVEFEPVDSAQRVSARGEIQPDGAFTLGTFKPGDGALEGEYRAIVMPPFPPGDLEEIKYVPSIDPRYQQFDTSGLKFTVTKEGDNEFHIQVARPGISKAAAR